MDFHWLKNLRDLLNLREKITLADLADKKSSNHLISGEKIRVIEIKIQKKLVPIREIRGEKKYLYEVKK